MKLLSGILLAAIGYLLLKAVWRLFKAVEVDRPIRKPPRATSSPEFEEENFDIEDARWHDLPGGTKPRRRA